MSSPSVIINEYHVHVSFFSNMFRSGILACFGFGKTVKLDKHRNVQSVTGDGMTTRTHSSKRNSTKHTIDNLENGRVYKQNHYGSTSRQNIHKNQYKRRTQRHFDENDEHGNVYMDNQQTSNTYRIKKIPKFTDEDNYQTCKRYQNGSAVIPQHKRKINKEQKHIRFAKVVQRQQLCDEETYYSCAETIDY